MRIEQAAVNLEDSELSTVKTLGVHWMQIEIFLRLLSRKSIFLLKEVRIDKSYCYTVWSIVVFGVIHHKSKNGITRGLVVWSWIGWGVPWKVEVDLSPVRQAVARGCTGQCKCLLETPNYNLESYGKRAFSVAAQRLWNSLPMELKTSTSIDIFKKKLNTYLFKHSYFWTLNIIFSTCIYFYFLVLILSILLF